MTRPRVSCVILCHDYGRYLERAITSCLNQEPAGYELHEVLVIDDGSTDDTAEVCACYADRVTVLRRETRGFERTLSDAIRLSAGDWVAPLDADDWFHPAKLRTCAPAMSGETLLVQHWEHVVDEDEQPLLEESHPGGNTSTLLVHRQAAASLLPVTNEIFFHVLHETGHGRTLRNPLTYYRVHPESMTDRQSPGISQNYRAQVIHELIDRLGALREDPPAWVSRHQLTWAMHHFRARAASHEVEAALQRGTRVQAWKPLGRMMRDTIRSGESLRPCGRALTSTLSGRPLVKLG